METTENQPAQSTGVFRNCTPTKRTVAPTTGNFLDVIKSLNGPECRCAKMHGLLDVKVHDDKQAEINFNNALCALQARLPVIKKD